MSILNMLKDYARTEVSLLPPTLLLSSTPNSLTIFDKYPKATFHFLVLPRLPNSDLSTNELDSLQSLLANAKNRQAAKTLLEGLKQDGEAAKAMIEEEMLSRFGFKWDVWIGFHAVPSMHHIHCHVLSADLVSPSLKAKKHYNSFHPKLGFFLHMNDVFSWFDAEPSSFDTMAALKKSQYEPLLKEDLCCWRCSASFKNMPQLKAHLQEEWDKEAKTEKLKLDKKRKRNQTDEVKKEDKAPGETSPTQPSSKRREVE